MAHENDSSCYRANNVSRQKKEQKHSLTQLLLAELSLLLLPKPVHSTVSIT
ncbi:hypothetical protein OIU79_018594, partial [Salix purpurea]